MTVWISPIVSNIGGTNGNGQAYHGYWTLDPTKTNDAFGTPDDLKNLVSAVHNKGMYVMVDVVVNHVAATAGADFKPSASYGPFSSLDDYHPYCAITDNFNQTSVEDCWLGDENLGLPDLNTESQTVVDFWNNWVKNLTSTYDFDSIRIDTVKHVRQDFWPKFVSDSGVYAIGEVLDGNTTYVAKYQNNSMSGLFNYPVYYQLVKAFNGSSGDIGNLVNWMEQNQVQFKDTTLLGNFLDNHDNPRFESYTSDASLIKNAAAFPFLIEGIPFVYYGQEQGFKGGNDPENREPLWPSSYATGEMYKFFTKLNQVRTAAANASSTYHTNHAVVRSHTANELIIEKGPILSVLSNRGANQNQEVNINTPTNFGNNVDLTEALTCTSYKTDGSGNLNFKLNGGVPSVFIATSQKGNLCAENSSATSGAVRKVGGATASSLAAIVIAAGLARFV